MRKLLAAGSILYLLTAMTARAEIIVQPTIVQPEQPPTYVWEPAPAYPAYVYHPYPHYIDRHHHYDWEYWRRRHHAEEEREEHEHEEHEHEHWRR